MNTSRDFFLWDYDSSLFPLRTTRLLVEKYAAQLLQFMQEEDLTPGGSFHNQHRVFATKRGWFLRPTLKLDPVAEFFLYDFVYRNRHLFQASPPDTRRVYGYRIEKGEPIPILKSYSAFKKAVAGFRQHRQQYIYFDVAAYFNRIYHHDLVTWFEGVGADKDDVILFGKFLREITAGRSVNCLPQGIYPSKMIGSSFLGFLEDSNRIRCSQTVRMMDDMWLFDNEEKTLIDDFLLIESLLNDRDLSVNEEKSIILKGHDPEAEVPPDLDAMKIGLLRRRREALAELGDYADDIESEGDELEELSAEEQQYLLSLLTRDDVQEEDAELVLTLMRDNSADVVEFIPTLISDFPGLAKRLYYFCSGVDDKSEVAEAVRSFVSSTARATEYQLFWFGMMAEGYLLKTPQAGNLLLALYDHQNATDISRAKILEIPEKRFGLSDLREEQIRTGHSDWLAWASAVGARVHAKSRRNHLLKYFRKSSSMNRLIGEFVETSF